MDSVLNIAMDHASREELPWLPPLCQALTVLAPLPVGLLREPGYATGALLSEIKKSLYSFHQLIFFSKTEENTLY